MVKNLFQSVNALFHLSSTFPDVRQHGLVFWRHVFGCLCFGQVMENNPYRSDHAQKKYSKYLGHFNPLRFVLGCFFHTLPQRLQLFVDAILVFQRINLAG